MRYRFTKIDVAQGVFEDSDSSTCIICADIFPSHMTWYDCTPHDSNHRAPDIVATLNQRQWRRFNVATTSDAWCVKTDLDFGVYLRFVFDMPVPAWWSVISVVNTIPNAGLMLGQRRRRWTNIKPALGQHLVLSGLFANAACHSHTPINMTHHKLICPDFGPEWTPHNYDIQSRLWFNLEGIIFSFLLVNYDDIYATCVFLCVQRIVILTKRL